MRSELKVAIFVNILILLAFLPGSAQTPDVGKLAVGMLTEVIKSERKGLGVELKDGQLYVDKKQIRVSTTVERDLMRNGVSIFAVRFDTNIEGAGPFSVGSIGIGKDKNDAVQTAVSEWADFFGKAFARFLSAPVAKRSRGVEYYPGYMGIRGEAPEGWLNGTAEMHATFFHVLTPILEKVRGETISVDILMSNSEGVLGGECRINNEVSAKLLDELKKLDWPKDKTYVFKQFYLVRRSSL